MHNYASIYHYLEQLPAAMNVSQSSLQLQRDPVSSQYIHASICHESAFVPTTHSLCDTCT